VLRNPALQVLAVQKLGVQLPLQLLLRILFSRFSQQFLRLGLQFLEVN
jgi:hypothetical protein